MSKRLRWVLIVIGIVVVAGAASFFIGDHGIEVDTASIDRGALSVTISEEGRTRVRQRFTVTAPVAGQLARIALSEGDAVSTGQVVATIGSIPDSAREFGVNRALVGAAEARRDQAASGVEEMRVQVEQAERVAERSRMLAETASISLAVAERDEQAAEAIRRQLDSARANLRAAEADVAASRAALAGGSSVDVVVPAAGRVLRILEYSERVVAAGTPLLEIGDTTQLDVVTALLSEDAVEVRPGQAVLINNWGGAETLSGEVSLVEPDAFADVSALGVQEQRVNVIVSLFDPPTTLGSGYRVEANIVTWHDDDVLKVPTSALFQSGGDWAVFAVIDGAAREQSVQIGHRSADFAEVLSGLTANDAVVVFPSDQISDGVAVAVAAE